MNFDPKNKTLIPCEPFEAEIFDLNQDKFVKGLVTGYWVAIREIKNPPDAMFVPINLGKTEPHHAAIVSPAWESLEPLEAQGVAQ